MTWDKNAMWVTSTTTYSPQKKSKSPCNGTLDANGCVGGYMLTSGSVSAGGGSVFAKHFATGGGTPLTFTPVEELVEEPVYTIEYTLAIVTGSEVESRVIYRFSGPEADLYNPVNRCHSSYADLYWLITWQMIRDSLDMGWANKGMPPTSMHGGAYYPCPHLAKPFFLGTDESGKAVKHVLESDQSRNRFVIHDVPPFPQNYGPHDIAHSDGWISAYLNGAKVFTEPDFSADHDNPSGPQLPFTFIGVA